MAALYTPGLSDSVWKLTASFVGLHVLVDGQVVPSAGEMDTQLPPSSVLIAALNFVAGPAPPTLIARGFGAGEPAIQTTQAGCEVSPKNGSEVEQEGLLPDQPIEKLGEVPYVSEGTGRPLVFGWGCA